MRDGLQPGDLRVASEAGRGRHGETSAWPPAEGTRTGLLAPLSVEERAGGAFRPISTVFTTGGSGTSGGTTTCTGSCRNPRTTAASPTTNDYSRRRTHDGSSPTRGARRVAVGDRARARRDVHAGKVGQVTTWTVYALGVLTGVCVAAVLLTAAEMTRTERRERRRGGDVTDIAGRLS